MSAACLGGCWYVDCSVLAVHPFAIIEPFFILVDGHSSPFFVTWFRACTRFRWVMLVMNDNFVRID
jgi:hypothetical protein